MKKRFMSIPIGIMCFAASMSAQAGDLERLEFRGVLSGAQEVSPPAPPGGVLTDTTSTVRIRFDKALSEAEFRLVVREGVGITQAHLHCGRAGENGPVVVFLFPFDPAGVAVDGELAQGTLTNADFVAADCVTAIGTPVNNIAALAFAARAGLIYANVHSLTNTGGEVRAQLLEEIEN